VNNPALMPGRRDRLTAAAALAVLGVVALACWAALGPREPASAPSPGAESAPPSPNQEPGTRNQEPVVVINMSTSRAIEDIAARHGARCERTAVGEVNVARRMRELGAIIGGEGNGGVIDPRVHYGRDSLVGIALILEQLARTGRRLSELVAALPRYAIVKSKVDLERGRTAAALERLAAGAGALGARADTVDGLRLDWPDRWVHVRPSNTEPVVRVIAEAADEAAAGRLAAEYVSRLTEAGGVRPAGE
jgi:phosphomannomutase